MRAQATALVTITTDASGDATGYTEVCNGRIVALRYVKTDYDAGVDFTITTNDTGQTVWDEDNVNASETVYPTAQAQLNDGTDLTFDGTYKVPVPICAANEMIKIVIANGGNAKSGQFQAIIEGSVVKA